MSLAVLLLAAGEGTRMRSSIPKVAHEILGSPMLSWGLRAARGIDPDRVIVVVGHRAEQVRPLVGDASVVLQEQQLGTAHAVMSAKAELSDLEGTALVMPGDAPLITPNTLTRLLDRHTSSGAAATVLTAVVPDPTGYGRIVRDAAGDGVQRIVEEKDATDDERGIDEINACVYAFQLAPLLEALGRVGRENAQGEHYLNDVVDVLRGDGRIVAAEIAAEWREVLGVNSREQLAEATAILQERLNRGWMERGVTIISPAQTFIGPDVSLGPDTVIWPGTIIEGRTTFGMRCRIGPNARVSDSVIGDDVTVEYAVIREASIGHGASVGPYASVRPATQMGDGAKAGTFVELKNTTVGPDSKVPHLSYMGDAIIGRDVNVGAGSITCNYDGFDKAETVVEDGAFIGSDTMLIAPVRVGRGAVIGAGSAISDDVPPDSLAVERSEQRVIEGWAAKRRGRQGES